MLTAVVTRCAICNARGPSSMLKKTCSHAPRLTSIRLASSRNERLNSPRRIRGVLTAPRCLVEEDMVLLAQWTMHPRNLLTAVGNKYIPQAPYSLDEYRFGRVGFDQFAQPRDLDVEAPVEGLVLAAARQFHELVARQRDLGMPGEDLEHGELAGGDGHRFVVLGQRTR